MAVRKHPVQLQSVFVLNRHIAGKEPEIISSERLGFRKIRDDYVFVFNFRKMLEYQLFKFIHTQPTRYSESHNIS